MKKLLLAVTLLLTTQLQAADTGTLLLTGTVAPINDIIVTPNNSAVNLNITGGEVNKLVAVATETSNSLTGYRILARSLNSSKLVNTVDSNYNAQYTFSYNGSSAVALADTDQVVKNISSLSGLTTQTSDIKVNVNAAPNLPAGTYSDLVTISIVAN